MRIKHIRGYGQGLKYPRQKEDTELFYEYKRETGPMDIVWLTGESLFGPFVVDSLIDERFARYLLR